MLINAFIRKKIVNVCKLKVNVHTTQSVSLNIRPIIWIIPNSNKSFFIVKECLTPVL